MFLYFRSKQVLRSHVGWSYFDDWGIVSHGFDQGRRWHSSWGFLHHKWHLVFNAGGQAWWRQDRCDLLNERGFCFSWISHHFGQVQRKHNSWAYLNDWGIVGHGFNQGRRWHGSWAFLSGRGSCFRFSWISASLKSKGLIINKGLFSNKWLNLSEMLLTRRRGAKLSVTVLDLVLGALLARGAAGFAPLRLGGIAMMVRLFAWFVSVNMLVIWKQRSFN